MVDSYYRERAYAEQRERRSRIRRMLCMALAVIAVPLAVLTVFLASYALTLIANGATPEQLAQAMRGLVAGCWEGMRQIAIEVKVWMATAR